MLALDFQPCLLFLELEMLPLFLGSKCQRKPLAALAFFNIVIDISPGFGVEHVRFVVLIQLNLAIILCLYSIGKVLLAF